MYFLIAIAAGIIVGLLGPWSLIAAPDGRSGVFAFVIALTFALAAWYQGPDKMAEPFAEDQP